MEDGAERLEDAMTEACLLLVEVVGREGSDDGMVPGLPASVDMEHVPEVSFKAARWAVDFLMVGIGCFSEGPAISWDESAAMLLRWREAKTDG